MSSWGYKDNAAIVGTVTAYTTNVNVVGSSTEFLANVNAGDYLTIAGQKYQVATVTSDTALTLTSAASANTTGATAYVQQGPKYVSNIAVSENVYTIQRIYGVDFSEMNTQAVASIAVYDGGAGYTTAARANTTVVIETSGVLQPTANATATINYSAANVVTSFTITDAGAGYNADVQANTTVTVATTGATQPTTNATGNINFTSGTTTANASHTGWSHYFTYTDAHGAVREKSEVLVAMSKNFTAAAAGDEEDVVFPD